MLLNAKDAPPTHSLRTMRTMSIITILCATAFHVKLAHSATKVPDFVKIARPAHKPLKMKPRTKPIVRPATVDVTKQKRAKTSASTATAENTNLRTVLLFVCPAMLGCINRKRGNRAAPNAQTTITPTNPNKPHAKHALVRMKRQFRVPPFVSNVRRGNSCPPTKHAHGADWER